MWREWWKRWLAWRGGETAPIEPHPPLAGDRDERRLEHTLYEGATRHVGSTADAPPDAEAGPESRT